MGLDMYAFSVKPEAVIDDFSFNREAVEDAVTEITYWRKHRHLHNYMEKLYRDKGGTEASFNCVPVRLTSEDVAKLKELMITGGLEAWGNPGFFFGSGDLYAFPEDLATDLDFIREAELAIESGRAVYYDSWW